MFAKISYTWSLMGASWDVVRRTKGLLLFPLLSGVCCLAVAASFAIPMFLNDAWHPPQRGAPPQQQIIYYGTLFIFYFCNYTVITYFNVAVVAGAVSRMIGGEPTIGFCFREANRRIHLILGWAAVSATVGLILRIIEDRSPKIGQFVAGLLGVAWALASFLVVPALVVDNVGPITALKESGKLLRKTWGEQIVGNFSFGLVFFFLSLPSFLVIGFSFYALVAMHSMILGGACIALGVLYLIGLGLVQSTLQAVFQAAVFMHARGIVEHGFPEELVRGAISVK